MIKRKERWGEVIYDTKKHSFTFKKDNLDYDELYPTRPLVLNVDLTFRCNMACLHCVAEDMANLLGGVEGSDLVVNDDLIEKLNKSPFLVIVITGGEPLHPNTKSNLAKLVDGLNKKGVVIDTNGTLSPPDELIDTFIKKDVLIRVSWDIPHPNLETKLRKYPKKMYSNDMDCMNKKIEFIKTMKKAGVNVAIQTVIHRFNIDNNNLNSFPKKLKQLGINQWYIQRFIPSHKVKNLDINIKKYEEEVSRLKKISSDIGIQCITKKDRRHNSVFLLVKDGDLYTQSDKNPGEKIKLGKIDNVNYFDFVSAPDHTARYYD